MRRIALWGGAVLLAAMVGVAVLWFAGRASLAARLDAEIARLEAEGYEVVHGDRAIGGFPLAYDVVYEDIVISGPDGAAMLELPRLTGVATLRDAGTVRFLFPPRFRAVLAQDGTMAEGEATVPDVLTVDIEADALTLETSPPAGPLMEFDVTAGSLLLISVEGEDADLGVAVELAGLDATLSVPAEGSLAPYRGRAVVERLDYAVSLLDGAGVRTTFEGVNDDITLSGTSELRSVEEWQTLLERGSEGGSAEFVYQTGPSVGQVKVQGTADGMDGTIEQSAGTGGGVVRIGQGRIETRASSQNNVYRLVPDDPGQPIRGEVSLTSFELVYDAPLAPSEEMRPFTTRLALTGLDLADPVWALVDPQGLLDRETAHLIAEITGTGRMVPLAAGEVPMMRPLQLGQVEIVAATLDALGAEVTAEGALDFEQPLNQPRGTVTVRATDVLKVIGDLTELGLLEPGARQAAALMAALYTRPGATPEELVAEITFGPEGINVNGLPVQ